MSEPSADEHFQTDHLLTDLKRRSMRGSTVTLTAQGIKFLMQFGSTVVLARLLTPEDYGLFAIGLALVTIFTFLKDLGLGWATVQSDAIDHRQVSALFWVNVLVGFGFALVLVLAAPMVSWIYHEPRLTGMLVVMASIPILNGLAVQHYAVMQRQMRYGVISASQVWGMALSTGVSLALAWQGAGYWALVAFYITFPAINLVSAWLLSQWRPELPSRDTPVRHLLTFGGHATGATLIQYAIRNTDNLLIGWAWGARALGFYDKAYQLLLLPLSQFTAPIAGVVITTLSRLQNDAARYREYYAKFALGLATLSMSLVAFLFVAANPVIELFLGVPWLPSAELYRALAASAFVDSFWTSMVWLYISTGQVKRQFRAACVVALVTLAGFLIGLPWSALGVAIAFSILRVALCVPALMYACHHTPVAWFQALTIPARPAVASLLAAVLVYIVTSLSVFPNLLVNVIVQASLFAIFYFVVWVMLPGGRTAFAEILRVARE